MQAAFTCQILTNQCAAVHTLFEGIGGAYPAALAARHLGNYARIEANIVVHTHAFFMYTPVHPSRVFFRIIKNQGGGGSPKTPSPPPWTKVTIVGKNEIYKGKSGQATFGTPNFGSNPPPPLLKRSPAPPIFSFLGLFPPQMVHWNGPCMNFELSPLWALLRRQGLGSTEAVASQDLTPWGGGGLQTPKWFYGKMLNLAKNSALSAQSGKMRHYANFVCPSLKIPPSS